MSSEKKAVDLGLLEEDDEFEEFPADGEMNFQPCISNDSPGLFSNLPVVAF